MAGVGEDLTYDSRGTKTDSLIFSHNQSSGRILPKSASSSLQSRAPEPVQ